MSWTFVVTYAICFVINFIPGCKFRATEEAEIVGMDEVELGEYVADYAYHNRDLEGNCPFPARQTYPAFDHEKSLAQAPASDVSPRKADAPLERTASPRDEPTHHGDGTSAQEVYPGGRGEGRMIYRDGEEAVTEKRG